MTLQQSKNELNLKKMYKMYRTISNNNIEYIRFSVREMIQLERLLTEHNTQKDMYYDLCIVSLIHVIIDIFVSFDG